MRSNLLEGRNALAAAIVLATACRSPEDPFTSGPARAAVTGVVSDSRSDPIPAMTVHIACRGGGPSVVAQTDSTGRYVANLATGSDPFDGGSGKLLCEFTEPTAQAARVRVDTTVGFARGPVLVALQFVDLHEH
jgi:hypothetical protein